MAGTYTNTYATDANSNITGVGTTTYGYDALNRVNAENPGTASSYTYDLTDNRLTKVQGTTTTTTVPSTSNKISAVGAASYTYDLAGNITGDGTNTYTWNAAGRLETVKVGATTVGTYTYDYLGRRAKKVAGATTTHYVYAPNGLLYGEYSSTGTLVKEYVYLNDAPLAQIATGSPEVLTYIHTDHLSMPRYATNTAGTTVWTWPNDAFGTSTPTATVTVNLRMPGQYFDTESGNFYNWNRYYNPRIGRYISPDPISQEGGLNLFSYVGQNPVIASDPMGLAINPFDDEGTEGVGQSPGVGKGYGYGGGAIQVAPSRPMTEVFNGYARPGASVQGQFCEPKIGNSAIPMGNSRSPMKIPGQQNIPTRIGNLNYTGHALDSMQSRGITPSIVENTIKNGVRSPGYDGATVFTTNEARVIVNPNGTIKTVYPK